MRKSIFLIALLFPVFLSAQNLLIRTGIEYKPHVMFQRIETEKYQYFEYNWSLDASNSYGAKVDFSINSFGFGTGLYYTTLGFNKNNPDTIDDAGFSNNDKRLATFEKIKFRVDYIELPLDFHYTFKRKTYNLNIGISYSFYFKVKSSLQTYYYEEHMNADGIAEVNAAEDFINRNAAQSWGALYPYAEFEYSITNRIFIAPRVGVLVIGKRKYHKILDQCGITAIGLSLYYHIKS